MPVTVFNNTKGVIHVSVALSPSTVYNQSGAYFEIQPNHQDVWMRTGGATAFVIKGNPVAQHGREPEIRFIAAGQTLVIN